MATDKYPEALAKLHLAKCEQQLICDKMLLEHHSKWYGYTMMIYDLCKENNWDLKQLAKLYNDEEAYTYPYKTREEYIAGHKQQYELLAQKIAKTERRKAYFLSL